MRRVLHVLSQRPSQTGSGITLDALVRFGAAAGWDQEVVAGVPATDPEPEVGGLARERIHTLVFQRGELPFPVPGMSDVMPYESTRFSDLSPAMVASYRAAWAAHLAPLLQRFRPDLVHVHHLWIVGSMIKDLAPGIPVVNHCHATGFRQMDLCPGLAGEVQAGCSRNDRFAVLHQGHATELVRRLEVPPERVEVVGAGYRTDLFHARGRRSGPAHSLLYIGKYSEAKGLPWLLDAFEQLSDGDAPMELHVAGSGAGEEADHLRRRMERMAPRVVLHGQLSQQELAELMRTSDVCVLPSFYEGVPLVLVEALACGCRLVATDLPGVRSEIAPHVGAALERVDLPRLQSIDRPVQADLPAFVERLGAAIRSALAKRPLGDPAEIMPAALKQFSWEQVFERVETIWRAL
ncbi:MAG: glycosyltransferase family 4 protein [Acidobacteria bacterium]|uniref:Glycosyltransferase family 4 protein n=1 Tax=Candidatus Polarisedimenticola svalbardensis TaxID=2886004 RepID=A0A8J6XWT5_9BACT|nr:glycosyltransferase family 4 protein [Candidatus Polarisedimenticola svalbardensis]